MITDHEIIWYTYEPFVNLDHRRKELIYRMVNNNIDYFKMQSWHIFTVFTRDHVNYFWK